jgi:hypothetical protein
MSREQRPVVEECERSLVLEDDVARNLTSHYLAEDARA